MGSNSYLDKVQTNLVFGMGPPVIGIIITRPLVFITNLVIFERKLL